jgi:hypothetical protein
VSKASEIKVGATIVHDAALSGPGAALVTSVMHNEDNGVTYGVVEIIVYRHHDPTGDLVGVMTNVIVIESDAPVIILR